MKPVLILCLLVVGLSACDSTIDSIDVGVPDPYLVGNYWVHERVDLNDDGTVKTRAEDSSAVVERGKDGGFDLITFNDNALYWKDSSGIAIDNCVLLFKYPAEPKDTMFKRGLVMVSVGGATYPGEIITFVEALRIPVTVPAGTFITNKYHLQVVADNGLICSDWIFYFTPGVGVIKEEHYRGTSTNELVLTGIVELLRYRIR